MRSTFDRSPSTAATQPSSWRLSPPRPSAAADPGALPASTRAGRPRTRCSPRASPPTASSFYVGSTTDGTIYRGALAGTAATPFLPGGQDGRTSAVGLKVADGYLFVAGGATGRFFVYDLDSGELVGSFPVDPADRRGPTFLNDVAVAPDGSVYITDSLRPVLYRIGPDDYATDGVETLAGLPRLHRHRPAVHRTGST